MELKSFGIECVTNYISYQQTKCVQICEDYILNFKKHTKYV